MLRTYLAFVENMLVTYSMHRQTYTAHWSKRREEKKTRKGKKRKELLLELPRPMAKKCLLIGKLTFWDWRPILPKLRDPCHHP